MHGQGNDFVMLNAIAHPAASELSGAQIRAIADRHFGVGCDQVLLVERPRRDDADFRYRIFNASGGEVEHCGNGSRCLPIFARAEGLTEKTRLTVETMNGVIRPQIEADGSVTVDMGAPRFRPTEIPFVAEAEAVRYTLDLGAVTREIVALSMGNPHAVQVVADVEAAAVTTEGPVIEHHPRFPNRVNAGFMQIVSRTHILLRVWERGAGETLACGTGACAAVVAGIRLGLLDEQVRVTTQGGDLSVTWAASQGLQAAVMMNGQATTVFRGEIEL
jgi:diaminopimelate epimerase